MISQYLVAIWSHSSHWGHTSVKYMECETYDQAKHIAEREAEYMDIIGAWVEDNVFDAYTLEGKGML